MDSTKLFKPYQFYSIILGFAVIASAIASIWVIYKLDPLQSFNNIAYFYASTGALILTTTALILFFFRQRFGVREMVQRHLIVSLRQGAWTAVLYIVALVLQSYNLFSWINSLLLIIALTFLEVYFLYNERKISNNTTHQL